MAPSKPHPSFSTLLIVRIVGAVFVTVFAVVFLRNAAMPKQKEVAIETPSPTAAEQQKNQPEAEAPAPDPSLTGKGLSEMVNDIAENAPKEMFEASDILRFPTKDGIYIFDTPEKFTQGIDEVHHSSAFYLSRKQGERNEHVVMMFVAPVDVGPKGNGLYLITAASKRGILDGGLGIGTNFKQKDKVVVDSWQGFARGSFSYTFDSSVSPGRQQGMDMFIYRADNSTGGIWVHIQMPEALWEEMYPYLRTSLDTLRIEV